MPLLAYCMMEAEAVVDKPLAGVAGTTMEELEESGLRCLFSRFPSREHISRIPAMESALSFHQVLQVLFRQAALISFRFPTVVENEEELQQYVREHASRYASDLFRLRHMVQMEIRLSTPRERGRGGLPASGREYLQGRQAQAAGLKAAAEQFRQATRAWVREWRERTTGEEIRCYALLDRNVLAAFQQAARELSIRWPGARLSGPWPPAEFMEAIKDS